MKINKFAFIVLGAFSLQVEHAHALEEVIVTSSILDKTSSDISDPIHILSGEDIATGALKVLVKQSMNYWVSVYLIMVLRLANLLSEVCRVQG